MHPTSATTAFGYSINVVQVTSYEYRKVKTIEGFWYKTEVISNNYALFHSVTTVRLHDWPES